MTAEFLTSELKEPDAQWSTVSPDEVGIVTLRVVCTYVTLDEESRQRFFEILKEEKNQK